MIEMTMLEKVARALCENFVDNHMNNVEINPKEYADNNWRDFEWAAQVAIEAMREPTDEVIEAHGDAIGWQRMIDAILAEKQKSPAA